MYFKIVVIVKNYYTFVLTITNQITNDMKVTRVIFSSINNKWYLQIDNLIEVETTERNAHHLINHYELVETNLNRWEKL